MHRQSFAEINLSHLKHNTNLVYKAANSPGFFCPMIKANAYGHGDFEVAKTLLDTKVGHLGVALVEEALSLREKEICGSILVFGGFGSRSCNDIISYDLTPVISDFAELEYLREKLLRSQKIKIHIKFNTGMSRLGFDPLKAALIRQFLDANRNIELEGVCTHLLSGEDAGSESGISEQQFQKLFAADAKFHGISHFIHALNSSAIFNLFLRTKNAKIKSAAWPSELGARPGIAIYGGEVLTQEQGKLDLRPVMSLKSKLTMLQAIRKDEVVSYGGHWRAAKDTLVGVVPVGYADGYFRNLTNVGEVLCHGALLPVIGTVCMDYFMIDLTPIVSQTRIQVGDEVVLIGKQKDKQILASDLARKVGTISYEVLTRISERVPRIYVTD